MPAIIAALVPLGVAIMNIIQQAMAAKDEDSATIAAQAQKAIADCQAALSSFQATLAADDAAADAAEAAKFPGQ